MQYMKVAEGARNAIAIYMVDYKLNRSTGNDEVKWTFT